jgi:hypothetical protein
MRRGAFIIASLLAGLAGCSSSQQKPVSSTQRVINEEPLYEASHASALAFSPPITQGDAPIDLSRSDREPSAFVGFDDQTRTYIYVRTDDRFSGDGNDRYERRSITEKIGASTR